MIFHIEPVADVFAFAIDGNGLAAECLEDDHRDELFRELKGPVIVRAIGDNDGEAVSIAPCPGKVVGSRLAGRVGRMGVVGRCFGEMTRRAE